MSNSGTVEWDGSSERNDNGEGGGNRQGNEAQVIVPLEFAGNANMRIDLVTSIATVVGVLWNVAWL